MTTESNSSTGEQGGVYVVHGVDRDDALLAVKAALEKERDTLRDTLRQIAECPKSCALCVLNARGVVGESK